MTNLSSRLDTASGKLCGDVALISGATTGIGRAVLDRFVAEGARVAVLGRRAEPLAEIVQTYGDAVLTVLGDAADKTAYQRAVSEACDQWGKLDILVANAGVFDFWRPMDRYDADTLDAAFDELIATNVKGYMFAAHAAQKALRASRGRIIFTGSVAGAHAGCGGVVYTMAKHAILGLTRQLALELAPDVRVNGVAPGATSAPLSGLSAMGQSDRTIIDNEASETELAKRLPLGFVQQPSDHTGLYVLLASRNGAPAMTGQMLVSDGGQEIRPV
jgi:NAD(P)-dependent dehydrogenase (short-subunit alcohol dehydrogenase family)